jgi:hypothetical protein
MWARFFCVASSNMPPPPMKQLLELAVTVFFWPPEMTLYVAELAILLLSPPLMVADSAVRMVLPKPPATTALEPVFW